MVNSMAYGTTITYLGRFVPAMGFPPPLPDGTVRPLTEESLVLPSAELRQVLYLSFESSFSEFSSKDNGFSPKLKWAEILQLFGSRVNKRHQI